ncbi:MAG: Gfo/Idh/MocA family oxidoreductase [Verrucomicrobiota bacterium]
MKKIRVAIIGQGRSGRDIHGAYFKTDARFKIMAAVDFLKERQRRAAEEYACDVYTDYHDLFKRRDLGPDRQRNLQSHARAGQPGNSESRL